MAWASGNRPLLFTLAEEALRSRKDPDTHWSLQHREPDGEYRVEIGHFPSEDLAEVALDALVAQNHGERQDFRVRSVTIEH